MIPRVIAAAAALALIVWTTNGTDGASAHEPHAGLQFSISIQGVIACDTRNGDATCAIPAGATFRIGVSLDSLPPDIPSYQGFDIYLKYAGVVANQDASNTAWPDCGFSANSYGRDGIVGFACAIGLPPAGPSTYTGLIGTNSFVCDRSGSVTLLHGAESGFTDLVESVTEDATGEVSVNDHSERDGTSEMISIICGEPPTPTPEPTPPLVLPSTGQQAPAPGGSAASAWLIAMLIAIGVALFVGAALLPRRYGATGCQ